MYTNKAVLPNEIHRASGEACPPVNFCVLKCDIVKVGGMVDYESLYEYYIYRSYHNVALW